MRLLISVTCLLFFIQSYSQKYTISGYVSDKESGEKLIGANVYDANTLKGCVSNNYGFYSLTLPSGEVLLTLSYVGYNTDQIKINLNQDTIINFSFDPVIELEEVEIVGTRFGSAVKSSQMSFTEIPVKSIEKLPVLLGEADIIKSIQLLPGVQSGTEGTSGLYVRGGGPDQNLILLDGVPVYNVNHLFGFFSVFNPSAVQNITLVKGGFPARYGGRLSSVLDVRMKEGNNQEFKGEGSVGIISSKLMIEGPIKKNKSSFIVSGRRTYIDILARPLIKYQARKNDLDEFNAGYYFYDLTGKVNYKISNKSTVFLSTYMGRDKAYLGQEDERNDMMIKSDFGLFWGNITTALRWNYMINKKLFSNSTLTYSRYRFITSIYFLDKDTINTSEIGFDYKSGIYDWTGKIDFDYIPNPNHYIKFGGSLIYHTFIPGVNVFNIEMSSENETEKLDTSFGNNNIYAYENDIYIEDDFEISSRLKTNIGLHYSGFHVRNTYYQSLQPRFSGRFLIMDNWSVKLAYSQMRQYLHLLSNVTIGMPTDLWLPVTDSIKPQKSTQYAIGSAFSIKDKYEISVEGFYKDMNNLIEYKEGASFMSFDNDWEDKIEIGKGWSYGIELFFEKKLGKTSGWIGYTLSWSWRQFENISFGNRFPYKYDRRHDISIVITHEFNEKWDVGATWVYGTGNAVTLATEKYLATFKNDPGNNDYLDLENMIEYFGDRNSFRMADYHRLDIGVNYHFELGKFKAKLNGAVYNVYNRKNPFILQFEDVFLNAEGTEQKTQLMQYTLFPLIPSINFTVSL